MTEAMGRISARELVRKASPAVRGGRVLVLEADPVMRPGPRIVEAVEAMARGFYPEGFGVTGGSRVDAR